MDYKEKFSKLVAENRMEEAHILLDQFRTYALEDSFYFSNMGWLLNHMERYMEAEIILRKGLTYYPDDSWMFSQLGFALNRQGNIEDGLEKLLTALQLGFDEPWVHGEIGWCYKELKNYEEAVKSFENGLLDDDKNIWLLSQAAFTYMAMNDMNTAEEYFLKSYHIHKDLDTIRDVIDFYKAKHDYNCVLEYLEDDILQTFEEYREYELGYAYLELDAYQAAIEHLCKALELGRDDTNIRSLLGDAFTYQGNIEEGNQHYDIALSYYEKALIKEVDHYWIYQEMIWIAHKQQNYEKKLQYLHRASEEYKNDLWMAYHYARVYSDLNQHGNAVEACRFCLQHEKHMQEMYDLIAWNLGRCHKENEAIEYLRKRIQEFGGDDWNYGELGWNYAQMKEYDQAINNYTSAFELNKESALHCSMLAWCYLRKEELETAHVYLEQALSLGRDDGWLYGVAGEIHTGLGQYHQAVEDYVKAIAYGYDEPWLHEEIDKLNTLHKEEDSGNDID